MTVANLCRFVPVVVVVDRRSVSFRVEETDTCGVTDWSLPSYDSACVRDR